MQCVPSCKPADPSEAPVGFGQVANTVLHLRAAEEGFKRADRKQSMEVLTPRHDAAERSASVVGCVFAILATIVGGGALSLPYALKSLGVLKGISLNDTLLSLTACEFLAEVLRDACLKACIKVPSLG